VEIFERFSDGHGRNEAAMVRLTIGDEKYDVIFDHSAGIQ